MRYKLKDGFTSSQFLSVDQDSRWNSHIPQVRRFTEEFKHIMLRIVPMPIMQGIHIYPCLTWLTAGGFRLGFGLSLAV